MCDKSGWTKFSEAQAGVSKASAMLVWILLIVLFWAVVPGLITGWMRRERGRSFLPGLLIGVVFGPLGILFSLALIYFNERGDARRRKSKHGRAVRVFYDIPVVGRLHVSTVWALAGLATFLCLWMIGGIGYEFYRTSLLPEDSDGGAPATARTTLEKKTSEANSSAVTPPADPKLTTAAQTNTSSQTHAALLGNISAQPGETTTGAARSENSATQIAQPASPDALGTGTSGSLTELNTHASSPTLKNETDAAAKASTQSREAAVSEVTQSLASSGHKVHAVLSGDAQTKTLSLTGATLTREAGNQLLGNRRLREALKGAGVRIVVMVNGQESWTYML
jgi:hypothetical protein